jgi:hypothetical protein
VLALLEELAVVRALAIVPLEMFDALMSVSATPLPEILVKVPVVPVMTLPANEPLESLATMVDAPFAEFAVVLSLATVPVVTFEPLIADRFEPSPIKNEPVIAPAANSPDVPRRTRVDAPLAELPVVNALLIVPLVMLEALMLVAEAAFPEIEFAVITLALNDPLPSRKTSVSAVAVVVPVVLAFAIVPEAILDALIPVRAAPLPDTEVNVPVVPVITFPAKEPSASRTTRVEAPLAEEALVLALSKVPVVIDEALMSVIAEPLPVNKVPVIDPAANAPPASRRTIVLAPLEELAVV